MADPRRAARGDDTDDANDFPAFRAHADKAFLLAYVLHQPPPMSCAEYERPGRVCQTVSCPAASAEGGRVDSAGGPHDILNSMRILVVSSHEQEFGGGEGRAAFEFAVELSRRHEVVLMYPGLQPEQLPEGARLRVYPIRSLDYTLPALRGRELAGILRFLDEFSPDVVHSHTPWFLGAITQAWAWLRAVPFFYTGHELPSRIVEWGLVRYLRGVLQSPLLNALARTYLVSFCRHCTGVVALNKAASDDIRGIGYRGRLHVIPNGRALALYNGTEPPDITGPDKVLTFVGDFGPRKNQKYLVEMMAHLPEGYQLHLVGHDVDHRYRREIDAAIGPGVRGRVRFTGKMDHSRIPAQLAMTHLWVSASLMEVQSLAVLEALASATPVLGLSNETIDELVDSGVGGRLERSATPKQFAEAVRRLCETDAESYRRMCGSARQRVQQFDWSHAMRKADDIYERAVRRSRPARRGTAAIPLLLATGQMLIAMLLFRIVKLTALSGRLQVRRRPRAVAVNAEA
jgi:glycosyltransferase involved in cell wall biosynthesis